MNISESPVYVLWWNTLKIQKFNNASLLHLLIGRFHFRYAIVKVQLFALILTNRYETLHAGACGSDKRV